jgi:drug/metabolite transporter (DMT)-like permease
MQNQNFTKIYFLLLLVPLFWGGAFGATKHVLTELPPLTASAVRFLIAGLLMVLWSTWRKEWNWTLLRQNTLSLLFLGLTGVFMYNFCFATGLQYTSAITGALVIVVNPVFTACAACIFMGEPWNWRTGLGVILSLLGVLLVITQGNVSVFTHQAIGIGEFYLLGAVASWVAYTLTVKKVMRHINASLTTTVSTLWGAAMLLAASLLNEGSWHKVLHLSGQTMLELLYLSVCSTVIAFLLYNWGVQRIGATKASAYINLMPVNALWIAAVLYGETVSFYHLLGMVLTITGVVITTQNKPQPALTPIPAE